MNEVFALIAIVIFVSLIATFVRSKRLESRMNDLDEQLRRAVSRNSEEKNVQYVTTERFNELVVRVKNVVEKQLELQKQLNVEQPKESKPIERETPKPAETKGYFGMVQSKNDACFFTEFLEKVDTAKFIAVRRNNTAKFKPLNLSFLKSIDGLTDALIMEGSLDNATDFETIELGIAILQDDEIWKIEKKAKIKLM